MRLSCIQENLSKGLGTVGRAVATKTTLPVTNNVLLAGHMPFLERLADLLLAPRGGEGVLRFTNSALVDLERTPNGYRVALIVPPAFVP